MRRLVLAPHMDDESLGCGGLLAKFPTECTVVTMTDSGAQRRPTLGTWGSRTPGWAHR